MSIQKNSSIFKGPPKKFKTICNMLVGCHKQIILGIINSSFFAIIAISTGNNIDLFAMVNQLKYFEVNSWKMGWTNTKHLMKLVYLYYRSTTKFNSMASSTTCRRQILGLFQSGIFNFQQSSRCMFVRYLFLIKNFNWLEQLTTIQCHIDFIGGKRQFNTFFKN